MKQNTIKKSRFNFFTRSCLGFTISCWSLFAGCDNPDIPTAPPESPAVDATSSGPDIEVSDSGSQVPPGKLELPSDYSYQPAPESDGGPEKSGGIEFPADVEIPVVSSGGETSASQTVPQVRYATWEEINQVAKSAGRITVVDLWSLSCEPCLKEFPGLVELHRNMGESVQCIAVDVDYDGRKSRPPEYYEERVSAFLVSVKASGFPAYISKTPSDDVFAITKLISIPAVLIYDAKGEVVKVFVDAGDSIGFTYEKDVVPFVKSLAG